MNAPAPSPPLAVIRGDWEGFAVYLEPAAQVASGIGEPGECVGVFNTLSGAARAAAAANAALADLGRMFTDGVAA